MAIPWKPLAAVLVAPLLAAAILPLGAAKPPSPDVNPAAIMIQPPDKINWITGDNGAKRAVLAGDPSKPGLYVYLVDWTPHHMSRPHFHQNDRFIMVLSGTWWVGTGSKYDPDSTVPVKAGSFVKHFAKQIHYDGAKDVDAVLEIVGEGPATEIPAEVK